MRKLKDLEQYMKAQFIWDRDGKRLGTSLEWEGSKELARNIFVGLATIYGFKQEEICEYIDCGEDSYHNKLANFVELYHAGMVFHEQGLCSDDATIQQKVFIKTGLILNAIKSQTRKEQTIKLKNYIDDFRNKP
jgi:hypothetical protein